MSSQYVNLSLSLLGLVCLSGAGVAVGSGVGMMVMQADAANAAPVAQSVKEPVISSPKEKTFGGLLTCMRQ